MEKRYIVYIHHNLINHKVYVGITCRKDPNARWQNGKGYKEHNPHFYAAIEKYGWNNFEHIIYAKDIPEESAYEIEKALIKLYHSNEHKHGYNQSSGGECSFVKHGLTGTSEYEKYHNEHMSEEQKLRNKMLCWLRDNINHLNLTDEKYDFYHENNEELYKLWLDNRYKNIKRHCIYCGKDFLSSGRNSKYCEDCNTKEKQNERRRESYKKYKEKEKKLRLEKMRRLNEL